MMVRFMVKLLYSWLSKHCSLTVTPLCGRAMLARLARVTSEIGTVIGCQREPEIQPLPLWRNHESCTARPRLQPRLAWLRDQRIPGLFLPAHGQRTEGADRRRIA